MQTLADQIAHYGGFRPAARALGVPESTLRRRFRNQKTPPKPLPTHAFVPTADLMPEPYIGVHGIKSADRSDPTKVKRFILTSAQNNCQVHAGLLKNLEALATHVAGEIKVSFTLYDKTGYRGILRDQAPSPRAHDIWWDKAVLPYVTNEHTLLHRRLAFCGELDLLATMRNPLAGFDSYAGRTSLIIPHNTFAMRCVPGRRHQMPKELYTTGSLTQPNFIQRRSGQLAHFHHILGALLVEVDHDKCWYVHHLNADKNGDFMWLDCRVSNGRVSPAHQDNVKALVVGDVHNEKLSHPVAEVSLFSATSPLRALKPATVILHDLIDFTSRNHHNIDDPLFRQTPAALHVTIASEMMKARTFLNDLRKHMVGPIVIVQSNHDLALRRWVQRTDWRTDPVNAEFYLRLAVIAVSRLKDGCKCNLLKEAIDMSGRIEGLVRWLDTDESYEVAGIECGMHGDIGPNGSKGSPKNLSRLGFKTFTAHTHTPSIVDGCYTVGVLGRLDMDYNKGPSSWMHAHGIIYANGKRAFIQIKNGKWRA